MTKLKQWKKLDYFKFIYNNFLILVGSFLLAIGTAVFLTRLSIVSGGLSGIAIIIQQFVDFQIIDIVVLIGNIIFWIIGFFLIGKDFSFKTLFSSITYPLFLSLFLRIEWFQNVSIAIAGEGLVGNILLCGLFAGVFVGSGVGLTFLGKGSTGGVDVLIFLFSKATKIRESIWSFIIDGSIIVISMFVIPNNWINSLVGIISAFVTALMIEFIYNGNMSSYQADIISKEWEKISRFAQDELLRGATIIHAQGGYKGEERIILRIVFEKRQFDKLSRYIASVDPKAFVTYTQAKAVYGEGFIEHK